MRQAFEAVLGEIPIFEKLEEVELQQIVRLEEKMAFFRETLTERMETSFRAMTQKVESRVELIVSFLALLQLIKEKFIVVEQRERFGDIAIRHRSEVV